MKNWKLLIKSENELIEVYIRALYPAAAKYGVQLKYSNCKILNIEEA